MRRRRKLRALVIVLPLLLALLLVAWLRLLPTVETMAMAQASDEASTRIAEAIAAQMEQSDISYDKIIHLEKDGTGRLLALQTDMNVVNRLRDETLARVNRAVLSDAESELGIPIGSILLPTLFSGHGPALPVRIVSVQDAGAAFSSTFTSAGINQTLHRIEMTVELDITLLTPVGTRTVHSASTVTVAETVLLGQVPSTMISTNRNGE